MKKYQSFLSKNFRFLEVKFSIYLNRRVFVMRHFRYRFSLNRIYTKYSHNENTPIQIYRKFHLQKLKISDKNTLIFFISAQNMDCGYSLEPPRRGGFNEYPQSIFLNRKKKNNV